MIITTAALADAIRDYLVDWTNMYADDDGDYRIRVDGTLDVRAMAMHLAGELDTCPCDCTEGEFIGRWTSGSFTGEGPLRSAYTCEAHSALVAAWCQLNTGLEPTFVATPAGKLDWSTVTVEATQ